MNQEDIDNNILCPEIVAGYNITTTRSSYDEKNSKIISAGDHHLFHFDVKSGLTSQITASNLESSDTIVSCNQIDRELYVFSKTGRVLVWDMDSMDWSDEFTLPLGKGFHLEAGLGLNAHQFCYTTTEKKLDYSTFNFAQRAHTRGSPSSSITLGNMILGSQNMFDSAPGILAFCRDNAIFIGKFKDRVSPPKTLTKTHLIKDLQFSCIRCSKNSKMIAGGDILGRVHIYIDKILDKCNVKRVTLHWHSLPVNDLCFSSTGNLLYSVGSENGCVVIWNLSSDYLGQKQVIARLGAPIRYINCAQASNELILTFQDNEIQFITTNYNSKKIKTFTTRASKIYENNYHKTKSVGLLYHSRTNCLVSNGKLGQLQFFSPRTKSSSSTLDILNTDLLALTRDGKVLPSDITCAAFSLDGEWLAAYETRDVKYMFPEVKLHLWRKRDNWEWIQTIDRLHETTNIVCLKFSMNNRYLLSVDDEGHMNLLHKLSLDGNSNQMFARGYFGKLGNGGHIKCAFSDDSSVISASIKDECPYLWTISNPYKIVFTAQFNFNRSNDQKNDDSQVIESAKKSAISNPSIEIYFGLNEHASTIVDIRKNHIRVWDVICPEKACRFSIEKLYQKKSKKVTDKFVAAAFDYHGSTNHFAACTRMNLVLLFNLEKYKNDNALNPLIVLDASLPSVPRQSSYLYTDLIFISKPINDCKVVSPELRIINRLCLMSSMDEIVAFNDKLELKKKSLIINSNTINLCKTDDIRAYFLTMETRYAQEQQRLLRENKLEHISLTQRQKMIKSKLEVKKLLKEVINRVPSHVLPPMEIMAPMILDKLLKNSLF